MGSPSARKYLAARSVRAGLAGRRNGACWPIHPPFQKRLIYQTGTEGAVRQDHIALARKAIRHRCATRRRNLHELQHATPHGRLTSYCFCAIEAFAITDEASPFAL